MTIPRRYGGLGFSALAHSAVVMKLSSRSIAAAVTVMVPNSLGPAKLLLRYGTGQQRDHYLPRLASGDEIPVSRSPVHKQVAMPEPFRPWRGLLSNGGWQQNIGNSSQLGKRYITLGPVATLIGLAFKLEDPDLLLGDDPPRYNTCLDSQGDARCQYWQASHPIGHTLSEWTYFRM